MERHRARQLVKQILLAQAPSYVQNSSVLRFYFRLLCYPSFNVKFHQCCNKKLMTRFRCATDFFWLLTARSGREECLFLKNPYQVNHHLRNASGHRKSYVSITCNRSLMLKKVAVLLRGVTSRFGVAMSLCKSDKCLHAHASRAFASSSLTPPSQQVPQSSCFLFCTAHCKKIYQIFCDCFSLHC